MTASKSNSSFSVWDGNNSEEEEEEANSCGVDAARSLALLPRFPVLLFPMYCVRRKVLVAVAVVEEDKDDEAEKAAMYTFDAGVIHPTAT